MVRCKICQDAGLRIRIIEHVSQGKTPWQIYAVLKKEGITCSAAVIQKHLEDHEMAPIAWYSAWSGLSRQFNTEDDRKRAEGQFLSKISIALELWEVYRILSYKFNIAAQMEDKGELDKITRLASEMRGYLERILRMQKERDLVLEVAKVVLFLCADGLVERMRFILSDLPVERRELVGIALKEEVKKALEYAKGLGGTDVDKLLDKVNSEYTKLVEKNVNTEQTPRRRRLSGVLV